MTRTTKRDLLFRQAELAEETGHLKSAFTLLTRAACLGDTGAQVNLGNFYARGKGTEQDFEKAAQWYTRAYRNGDRMGANNLAIDLKESRPNRGGHPLV